MSQYAAGDPYLTVRVVRSHRLFRWPHLARGSAGWNLHAGWLVLTIWRHQPTRRTESA